MIHFVVDRTSLAEIYTAYPHDPEDQAASFQEYLEAKLTEGLEFVAAQNYAGSVWFHIFKIAGREP